MVGIKKWLLLYHDQYQVAGGTTITEYYQGLKWGVMIIQTTATTN